MQNSVTSDMVRNSRAYTSRFYRPIPASLFFLLISTAILLIAWSFVVPIFEAPDEPHHLQYAEYLHSEKKLPIYGPGFAEANSPPLYYLLIAFVTEPASSPPPLIWQEDGKTVIPLPPRLFENTQSDLHYYWNIRAARLITIFISLMTVFASYWCGVELTGKFSTGLIVASLVAFLPQFTFRGMNISNDALLTCMSAISLYFMVRIIKRGFTWQTGIALALACACTFLSKSTVVFLPIPIVIVLISDKVRLHKRVMRITIILGIFFLIISPWLLRNQILYGDPLARAAMNTAVGQIISEKSITSQYFYTEFPRILLESFIGVFGWMNLYLPDWLYQLFTVTGIIGTIGTLLLVVRRKTSVRIVFTALSIIALNLAVVVVINLTFTQPQGRYMFAALPAIALIVGLGIEALLIQRSFVVPVIVVGLVVINAGILLMIVWPAYWPAPLKEVSQAVVELQPTSENNFQQEQNGQLRVVGVDAQISYKQKQAMSGTQIPFLYIEVTGKANVADQHVTGAVYFALEDGRFSENQRIPFSWIANEKTSKIVVPLFTHPLWSSQITGLRLDPFDAGHQDDYVDATLYIQRVTLFGNLGQVASLENSNSR